MTTHFAFSSYRPIKKSFFFFRPVRFNPLIVNVGTFCEMLVPAKNIFSIQKKNLAL